MIRIISSSSSQVKDYSDTMAAVSRMHGPQVDATITERQPCTKLNKTR